MNKRASAASKQILVKGKNSYSKEDKNKPNPLYINNPEWDSTDGDTVLMDLCYTPINIGPSPSILNLATQLLRPRAETQELKAKSGLQQIIDAQTPSGYDTKKPISIKKEELIYSDNGIQHLGM